MPRGGAQWVGLLFPEKEQYENIWARSKEILERGVATTRRRRGDGHGQFWARAPARMCQAHVQQGGPADSQLRARIIENQGVA